jgi:hypothetical protein
MNRTKANKQRRQLARAFFLYVVHSRSNTDFDKRGGGGEEGKKISKLVWHNENKRTKRTNVLTVETNEH